MLHKNNCQSNYHRIEKWPCNKQVLPDSIGAYLFNSDICLQHHLQHHQIIIHYLEVPCFYITMKCLEPIYQKPQAFPNGVSIFGFEEILLVIERDIANSINWKFMWLWWHCTGVANDQGHWVAALVRLYANAVSQWTWSLSTPVQCTLSVQRTTVSLNTTTPSPSVIRPATVSLISATRPVLTSNKCFLLSSKDSTCP